MKQPIRSVRSNFSSSLLVALTSALVACGEAQGTTNPENGGLQGSGGNSGAIGNGGTLMAGGQIGAGGILGGGAPSSGGTPGGGGTIGVGGTTGAGGIVGSGGGTPPGNGGATGTGGAAQCTDAPPPNGDTCEHAVQYGWCGAMWMNGACARSCGVCSGGAGGTPGTGGSQGSGGNLGTGGTVGTGGTLGMGGNVGAGGVVGGQNGWASRYWDCCKPACGWKANVSSGVPMKSCDQNDQTIGNVDETNACDGGNAFMCWSGVPWSVSDTLSYGFAAVTGSQYVCGRCYQLQFTGSGHSSTNAGAASLNGKTMIVQVINNGGVGGDQFDLLIPGGGVGDRNACTRQWNTSDLGAQYGGFLTACNGNKSCVQQRCDTVFAGKPELQAGCSWFLGWFNGADNPNLVFKQVACPSAITQRSGMPDPG